MEKEICDYYEPLNKRRTKRRKDDEPKTNEPSIVFDMCKYFTGDIHDKRQVARCRYYCSIIECGSLMGHSSYKRKKGAITQR